LQMLSRRVLWQKRMECFWCDGYLSFDLFCLVSVCRIAPAIPRLKNIVKSASVNFIFIQLVIWYIITNSNRTKIYVNVCMVPMMS
jgi:hypothetical protein